MKAKALTALLLGSFLLSARFLTTTSKGSIPTTPTSSVVSDNSKDGVLGKLIENLSNPKHLYQRQNYFRKYLVALPFPSFSNKPSAKNLLSVLISESFESFRSFSSPT